jgi:hypothetical protein
MPTPHYSFVPPSGSVLDQNEPRAYWNGRAWNLNGKNYPVPSGHRLVGKSGGQLDGWYYDWQKRAWMEPDKGSAKPGAGQPGSRPASPGQRPSSAPHPGAPSSSPHPAAPSSGTPSARPAPPASGSPSARPAPAAAPASPPPASQPTYPQQPAIPPEKECSVNQKDQNALEYLVKHPVAPLVGGFVLLGSLMADEPAPPTIPDGLPEATAKQWQMIYAQNLARFERRMALWENLGKVLLGYTEINTILAALPPKRAA